MIQGTVTAREATIQLTVSSATDDRTVTAVIDTGFDGFLTLPQSLIDELGLPFRGSENVILADGQETTLSLYTATVSWDGQERRVLTLAVEDGALIGMNLLEGHLLTICVVEDGPVTITLQN